MRDLATSLLDDVSAALPDCHAILVLPDGDRVSAISGGISLSHGGGDAGLYLAPDARFRVGETDAQGVRIGAVCTAEYRGQSVRCRITDIANSAGLVTISVEAVSRE